MYSIQETQDFYPLSLLYQERGLEVTPSHTPPQGTLFMLRCEDSETGELAAAATLQRRAGHFVLAHLAVASHLQGSGLGSQLLASAPRQAAGRPGTLAGGKGSRLLRPVSLAHCPPGNGSSHFPLSHLPPVPSGLFSQHYEKGTLF